MGAMIKNIWISLSHLKPTDLVVTTRLGPGFVSLQADSRHALMAVSGFPSTIASNPGNVARKPGAESTAVWRLL
jgi:hypothetical protein